MGARRVQLRWRTILGAAVDTISPDPALGASGSGEFVTSTCFADVCSPSRFGRPGSPAARCSRNQCAERRFYHRVTSIRGLGVSSLEQVGPARTAAFDASPKEGQQCIFRTLDCADSR